MPISLRSVVTSAAGLVIAGWLLPAPVSAQATNLSGSWAIDRDASQFPREIGFGVDWMPATAGGSAAQGNSGGRRRGGGGAAGAVNAPPFSALRESPDDAMRRDRLTAEVKTPPARLTIDDKPDAVTITDDLGISRTVHPDGRAEVLQLFGVPILTTAHREMGKLIVLYSVEDLRQLRYTYARTDSPAQVSVDVQFVERGGGDTVHRVYRPPSPDAVASTDAGTSAGSGRGLATLPPRFAGGGGPAPSAPGGPPRPAPLRVDGEFSGLTRIGVVVEELTSLAAGCGLKHADIESAVAKHFTDAGLKVIRDSDEDTYVYVNVMTSSLPTGMCISRYDWYIYSNTQATLSYQHDPLLAQVTLAHKGGLTGSGATTHEADVQRGLDDGLAQIAGRIHDANK